MSVHSNFAILQYNTMKSRDKVMAPLLRDPTIWDYDVLAIQEPWHNKHNNSTHHPCKDRFHLVYPEPTEGESTRVCFYINSRLNRADWTVQTHSRDLMTLKIQYTEHSQSKRLCIHNVYREAVRGDTTATLEQLNGLLEDDHWQHIIVGDFNLHHPTWGGLGVEEDPQAEQLIQMMDERQLSLLLPQGSVTWRSQQACSTIDLVLGSPDITQRLISCEVQQRHHDSDHYPIATHLLLSAAEATPRSYRQWDRADIKLLQQTLAEQLPTPLHNYNGPNMEQHITAITEAIQAAVKATVPMSTPSK